MTFIQKNSFIILFFTLILLLSFYTIFSNNDEQSQMSQVKIEDGDTLWTLAETFSGNTPHHEWIDEIMEENQLSTAKIKAGQSLKIPSDQLKFAPDDSIKLASDSE